MFPGKCGKAHSVETQRQTPVNLLKFKDKERILQAPPGKKDTFPGGSIRRPSQGSDMIMNSFKKLTLCGRRRVWREAEEAGTQGAAG